jgi:hypothetical protein
MKNILRKWQERKSSASTGNSKKTNTKQGLNEIFTAYYEENYWGSNESVSGRGSENVQTIHVQKILNSVINEFNIKSILDIPCGDFNWIKNTDIKKINYIGADIVEGIIRNNSERFSDNNLSFECLNIVKDRLPTVDLIFVRDCLVHLSYENVLEALVNIKNSGSKYLLTTSFIGRDNNHDIKDGDWRPLNLEIDPINLPEPLKIYAEKCTENNDIYRDKCLNLWVIDQL